MKYKLGLSCIVGLSLLCVADKEVNADYILDYNVSVMDTIFKESIFDFSVLPQLSTYSTPAITSDISTGTIEQLDYNVELLNYKKTASNYLIFYSLDNNKIPTELFRIKVDKSGAGQISDGKLLNKLQPNTTIIMNVMSYEINNGKVENLKYSPTSKEYYTKKTLNLVVKEGNKEVVNRTISLANEAKDNKVLVYPYEVEQYYRADRYYSYTNEKIEVDGKEYNASTLEIPYNSKKLVLNLSKNMEYWRTISVVFPNQYSFNNEKYDVKRNSTLGEFFKENNLESNFAKNDNYTFEGYYYNNEKISKDSNTQVTDGMTVNAVFNTKIVLDNGDKVKETTLLTGQKLSEIDKSFFEKDKYNIESYSIYDNENNEKIKDITNLDEEAIDKSITIKANYKEKTNIVSVRQDDYNKRFGKVDESIRDKDIQWSQTKKIGELLKDLREKIKPSTGYEAVFRINKKVVDDSEFITNDIVLEIYFRKVDEDWVNVKFVGKGIDKFLSDGQEVLINTRIDSMINLPSATGETSREFLGWQANEDYIVASENSEKKKVSKNRLLQTNELGAVVTEKGKNLVFTAVYREIFKVEFEKTEIGSITLSKGTSNILEVEEFNSIGDATENNKIIVVPRSGYSLSYFVANKTVKVNVGNSTKEILAGQKIEENDLYNIVPTSDLKLTPVFYCSIFADNLEEMIDNNKIKNVEDTLNLEFESKESIRQILGPLYYLR